MSNNFTKLGFIITACIALNGCLVASVVGTAVGTAVDVVDTVTPDIID